MSTCLKALLLLFPVIIMLTSCSKDDLGISGPAEPQPGPGQVNDPAQDSTQNSTQDSTHYTPYYDFDNIIPGAITVAHLSEPAVELAATVCNDKFYYAGNSGLEIFDPVAGTLTVKNFSFNRAAMAAAAFGNKVFFAGGLNYYPQILTVVPSSKVDIYNTDTETWTTHQLSVARYGIKTFTYENKVFFAGGRGDNNTPQYNSIDIYDAASNSWSIAQLSGGGSPAITVVGNKIWFVLPGTGKIDVYDPGSGVWTAKFAPLIFGNAAVTNNNAAITLNNKIYFTGWPDVDVYDIPSDTWSRLSLSEQKFLVPVGVSNNKIAFIGGMTSWFVYSTKIEIYDPATNVWSYLYMNADLYYQAIISHNNYIYSAGGFINQENNMLKEIYRFSL